MPKKITQREPKTFKETTLSDCDEREGRSTRTFPGRRVPSGSGPEEGSLKVLERRVVVCPSRLFHEAARAVHEVCGVLNRRHRGGHRLPVSQRVLELFRHQPSILLGHRRFEATRMATSAATRAPSGDYRPALRAALKSTARGSRTGSTNAARFAAATIKLPQVAALPCFPPVAPFPPVPSCTSGRRL